MRTIGGNAETHGTRDRIVRLLLEQPLTIEDLADSLDITKNAVRAQIALLQRDQTVEVQGTVKSGRRPAAVYGVRPGADVHGSKVYAAVLASLLRVLTERMPHRELKAVLKELGRELAAAAPRASGTVRKRVSGAVLHLRSLGSRMEIADEQGKVVITSASCPLGRITAHDAHGCMMMESLLAALTGLPVEEHCDHSGHPRCRFVVATAPEPDRS